MWLWVDTSALRDIADGDTALERELLARRAAGDQLLMVPKVREEFLLGNPLKKGPVTGNPPNVMEVRQAVITRLGVQVDMMGTEVDRRAFLQRQFTNRGGVRSIEESDTIVISQVAASARARNIRNPALFTTDQRLVNNGNVKLWGVTIAHRTSVKPPTPPGGTPGGGGPPAAVKGIQLRFGGKIGRGLRIVGGNLVAVAVKLLSKWLLGKLIEKQQEESLNKQMEEFRPIIEDDIRREKHSSLKLLVDGKNAFATVRISITFFESHERETGWVTTGPSVIDRCIDRFIFHRSKCAPEKND
jgi:hypothetical protein